MTGIVLAEWTNISRLEGHFETEIDHVRLMNDGAPSLHDDYAWWNELRAGIWNRSIVEMEPRLTAGLLVPSALISSVYPDADDDDVESLRRRSRVEPSGDDEGRYDRRQEDYLDRWHEVTDLHGRR